MQFCSDSLDKLLNSGSVVTSQEMRLFALDCLRWPDETAAHASQRDLVLRVARTWMNIAASIERHIGDGSAMAVPDLLSKLN